MLDVLIVNYNNANQVISYVERIKDFRIIDRILIVDNASTDSSFDLLKSIADSRILVMSSGRNGGYGYGNNFGIRFLREVFNTKYVLISNSDVYYDEKYIECIYNMIVESAAAISTGVMLSVDAVQTYPWRIPNGWQYVFHSCFGINRFVRGFSYDNQYIYNADRRYVDVDCVPGSLLLVCVEDFVATGGYDEDIFLYCEETVLGIRMKASGFRSILIPSASFVHDHPRSTVDNVRLQSAMWRSRIKVLEKYYHFGVLELTLVSLIAKLSNALYRLRAMLSSL